MADVNAAQSTGPITSALPPTQPKESILSSIPPIRSIFGKQQPVSPSATPAAESVPAQEPTQKDRPLSRAERLRQSVQAGGAFMYRNASKHPIVFTLVCSAIVGIAAKIFLTHRTNAEAAKFAALSEHLAENSAGIDHLAYDDMIYREHVNTTIFGAAKKTLQEKSDPMSYLVADADAGAFSQTEGALAPVIGQDSAEALLDRTVSAAIAKSDAESTSFEGAYRYADNAAFQESRKETIFGAAKRAFQQKLETLSDPLSYINPVADEDAYAFSQTEDALAPVIGQESAEALLDRTVSAAIAKSDAESTSFEEAYRYADNAAFQESRKETIFGAAKRAFQQKLETLSDPLSYINPVADEDAYAFSQTEGALAPVIGGDSAEVRIEEQEAESLMALASEKLGDWFIREETARLERIAKEEAFEVDDRFAANILVSQGDILGEKKYKFPGTDTYVKEHVAHLRSLTSPRVEGEGADLRITHDPKAVEGIAGSTAALNKQQRRIKLL